MWLEMVWLIQNGVNKHISRMLRDHTFNFCMIWEVWLPLRQAAPRLFQMQICRLFIKMLVGELIRDYFREIFYPTSRALIYLSLSPVKLMGRRLIMLSLSNAERLSVIYIITVR